MYDAKIELCDRIHTFEGFSKKDTAACCSIDSKVPDVLHSEINEAIIQIRDHLSNECKIKLKSATFYFKYDKTDNLYLIYSAGINATLSNSDGE